MALNNYLFNPFMVRRQDSDMSSLHKVGILCQLLLEFTSPLTDIWWTFSPKAYEHRAQKTKKPAAKKGQV